MKRFFYGLVAFGLIPNFALVGYFVTNKNAHVSSGWFIADGVLLGLCFVGLTGSQIIETRETNRWRREKEARTPELVGSFHRDDYRLETHPDRWEIYGEPAPELTEPFQIRDATDREWDKIKAGVCPFCHGRRWLEGPHGGMSVNISCDSCGAGVNVTGPFRPQIIKAPVR